jgi:predicted ATPase
MSEEERSVFMKLSVFRGGFSREAAEYVASASLRTLSALVDKSLLRVDVNGRYDLHELLRQFAADKLDQAGQAAATAHRHLDYFLKLAGEAEAHVYGSGQRAWFDRLEIELDNVRAALTWAADSGAAEAGLRIAAALSWFFQCRGHWREGLAWLERMIDLAVDADTLVRAKAFHRAGELSLNSADGSRAQQYCQEALALAHQANDRRNIAWALAALAYTKHEMESHEMAAPLYE